MAKRRNRKPLKKKEENKDENGVDPGGERTEHLKPSIDFKNLRLCRLCESKEEPFVKIFDTEKVSKQIENLIPFTISKTDGLPDTVCFRCVAKVDEFHEFIDKCLKTQDNLHNMLGKNPPVVQTKSKERIWWEKTLMATNKSHEDICDAVVKKAMQAIITNGDTCPPNHNTNTDPKSTAQPMTKVGESPKLTNANTASTKAQQMPKAVASPKLTNANTASTPKAPQRQKAVASPKLTNANTASTTKALQTPKVGASPKLTNVNTASTTKAQQTPKVVASSKLTNANTASKNTAQQMPIAVATPSPMSKKAAPSKKNPAPTPQTSSNANNEVSADDNGDVMIIKDEIDLKIESIPFLNVIKVHGVGLLYQCTLCNRNYLNKNVVVSHSCVKNHNTNIQTVQKQPQPPPVEVPKPETVKFINTTFNDQQANKSTKPKVGPASKTGRRVPDSNVINNNEEPKPIYAPTMTPQQLKALYSKNSYTFIPCSGNKFLLQKKKTPETDNSPEKVTKANRPQKTHTVTSATVSGASGSADPYPVALLRIKKPPAAVPEPEIQTNIPDYTCNVCCEKFNRQQKLAAHLQSHFQDEIDSPKLKRMRHK